MGIEVRNLHKSFGSFIALEDVSLTFPDGELVALLGPSGCGKTTLLRIIAGIEQADRGRVLLDGIDASDTHVRDRQVGFVFQHYALFRHMTVFDNVAFGLRMKPRAQRPSKAEIREKVHGLLDLVQLDWLHDRYPSQLSGGQRQRIALARALAVEPRVLLLDEPFGALDAQVRKELRRWLRHLHDDLKITSIFVTHDQEEAMEVSDRVVLMNHGKVEQCGSPDAVYEHPASPFVYQFLGNVNLFHGRSDGKHFWVGDQRWAHGSTDAPPSGEGMLAFVRPYHLRVEPDRGQPDGMLAQVEHVLALGSTVRIELSPLHPDAPTPAARTSGEGASGQADASLPPSLPRYLEVELSRDQAHEQQFQLGQVVRLYPTQIQVF